MLSSEDWLVEAVGRQRAISHGWSLPIGFFFEDNGRGSGSTVRTSYTPDEDRVKSGFEGEHAESNHRLMYT